MEAQSTNVAADWRRIPVTVCAVDRLSWGHWQDQDKEVSFSYHYIFYIIYLKFQYVV